MIKTVSILFSFLIFFASCNNSSGIDTNMSEAELYAVLKSDTKFIEYCAAMKDLSYATAQNRNSKDLSILMRAAINNKEIKNIEQYRQGYIANGGDTIFLNAFHKVYNTKQELKERYKVIIEKDPEMFQRVVRNSCDNK